MTMNILDAQNIDYQTFLNGDEENKNSNHTDNHQMEKRSDKDDNGEIIPKAFHRF